MRTCQSCGLENPDDRDFCDCGEYLRWDPTGFVQAVTPEMAAAAAAETPPPAEPAAPQPAAPQPPPAQPAPPQAAAPPPPQAPDTETPFQTYAAPPPPVPPQDEPEPTPPPVPEAGNGHALIPTPPPQPVAPPPNAAKGGTLIQGAVPAPPPPPQEAPAPPAMASITLKLPDEDAVHDEVLALGVDPGGRERLQAVVRNQSGIVDNYELKVAGLPDAWWTIYPNTLYLVPFGTGGTYEQQVEIHLHPPRSPEAEARLWDLALVAHSKAYSTEAATAPFVLGIQPFEQFDTKVKPERASGRRKVRYQVAVENKANAPVRIGFEGVEPDNECKFAFAPGQIEIAPGEATETTMTVRPPKQIWIGRPHERRLEVKTHTGENADLLEAQQASADNQDAYLDQMSGEGEEGQEGGGHADAAKGLLKKAGVRGPQVAKPKLGGGGLAVGPQGVRLKEPVMRAPSVRGPRMQQKNIRLDQLKIPSRGGGAPPPVTGPLLPTQAVFRQKSWLPWWIAVVVPLLALLALLLFLLLPKNAAVPNVVGQKSAFDAEKLITKAGLTLNPQQKTAVVKDAKKVGFVLDQTPKAGEKAEKGKTQVSVVIGIGNGQIEVPKVVGLDLAGAEKTLRESKLTLGKTSITPPDPKAKIVSQIPAEREVVKEGTPVDIFYLDPAAQKAKEDAEKKKKNGAAAGGGGGGGGGGAAADIIVPAIAGQELDAFAQAISKQKLVPQVVKKFDNSPKGTLFATDPPGGTKVKAGSNVKLLVSAGFPQLAFDDDKDVLLISGANGEKLDPIAKGSQAEKDPTWSFAGDRVAFQSEGQVFLKDPAKPDDAAIPLTPQGDFFKDLAWAPTGNANVLAMIRVPDKGLRELCLGQITKDGMTPACMAGPKDVMMDSSVNWAPDGRSILVFGFKVDATGQPTGAFGMMRFTTKKPFSFDVKDWKAPKRFLSDVSQTDKGMLDAVISPDGKQMAVVANFNGPKQFRVLIAKRNDFLLQNAKDLKVKACKVIWLPDQTELLVVQADDCNTFTTGELVRVNVKNPDQQQQRRLAGDNPSYQPLTIK
jgi:beta-lactam-binding protein with PASTA domain